MGNMILRKKLNIDESSFLGTEDNKFAGFLKHFYDNDNEGDSDQKFNAFIEILENNDDIRKVMA